MPDALYQLVGNPPTIVALDGTGTPPPPPPPPSAPTANASGVPLSGAAPLTVAFSSAGSSAVSPATITGYAWTFGDGTTGTGANPSHTYQAAGNYQAKLTVTDSNGLTATDTVAVTATTVSGTAYFVVGMYNACSVPGSGQPDGQNGGAGFPGNGTTAVNFRGIADRYFDPNKMKVARFFYQMPTADSDTWINNGITQHASIRGDALGTKNGAHNATIVSFVKSLSPNCKITYWHEFERSIGSGIVVNDSTGAYSPKLSANLWRDAHIQVFKLTKNTSSMSPAGAGRTDVQVCSCNTSYKWSAPGRVDGDVGFFAPDDYWPGAAFVDVACTDAYFMESDGGATSITQNARHMNWHNYHKTKLRADGTRVPLGMTEFGVLHTLEERLRSSTSSAWGPWTYKTIYTDAQMQTLIINSLDWFLANGYVLVLYWNAWHADFYAWNAAGARISDETQAVKEHFRDFNITPTSSDTTHVHPNTLAAVNSWMAAHATTSVIYAT